MIYLTLRLPQSSDELVLSGELKKVCQELPPHSDVFQLHPMENTKIKHCLAHGELPI